MSDLIEKKREIHRNKGEGENKVRVFITLWELKYIRQTQKVWAKFFPLGKEIQWWSLDFAILILRLENQFLKTTLEWSEDHLSMLVLLNSITLTHPLLKNQNLLVMMVSLIPDG